MHATNTSFSEEIYSSAPQSHLNVSMLYQDLSTGMRARQFLYTVLDDCQMQVEFSLALWNIALFHSPEIQEQALTDACKANLVLLSIRGDSHLGSETEDWLNQWVSRRCEDEECALAVLIGSDMQRLDSIGQTILWLQHVTRPTQVRLFVGFLPVTITEQFPILEAPQNGKAPTLATSDIANRLNVYSEGGLNE